MQPCDNCGSTEAREERPRIVTSAIGLYLWNQLHPGDQREQLVFCSDECTLDHGRKLGEAMLRTGKAAIAAMLATLPPGEYRVHFSVLRIERNSNGTESANKFHSSHVVDVVVEGKEQQP